MDANAILLLSIALVVIVTIYYYKTVCAKEDFVGVFARQITEAATAATASAAATKPILWYVVDDYGTNNRRWIDFGSRTSKDLNMSFLAITKSRCLMTQGADFDVRFLLGREAVATVLATVLATASATVPAEAKPTVPAEAKPAVPATATASATVPASAKPTVPAEAKPTVPALHLSVPPSLWRAWARSALMRYCGGLYMDGLSLCLGPSFMSCVKGVDAAVFGTEHDEPRTSALDGSCSPFAGWSLAPGHKAWTGLNKDIVDLVDGGVLTWTAAVARNQISEWHGKHLQSVPCMRACEWSRLSSGKPIELEDLFGRGMTNEYVPGSSAVYLPLDYEMIDRSVTYKWFLSLPVEQILAPESQFLWAKLAQKKPTA